MMMSHDQEANEIETEQISQNRIPKQQSFSNGKTFYRRKYSN